MVIQDKNLYRLKAYPRGYKKRLKRINKKRERLNTNRYVNNVFDDLADYYFDNLTYGDSLRDMYGQLISSRHDLQHSEFMTDANYQEYLLEEDPNWLEYLGKNGTLEDELDYCDKIYEKWQPEDDYNFTEEEKEYAVNSWNKAENKEGKSLIERAKDVLQACKDYQETWQKYGLIERFKLYFGIGKDNS